MPMAVLTATYFEEIKVLFHKDLSDLIKKEKERKKKSLNSSHRLWNSPKLWAHKMDTQALANQAGVTTHHVSQKKLSFLGFQITE